VRSALLASRGVKGSSDDGAHGGAPGPGHELSVSCGAGPAVALGLPERGGAMRRATNRTLC